VRRSGRSTSEGAGAAAASARAEETRVLLGKNAGARDRAETGARAANDQND
jgi:hypothetical protein